MIYFGCRPTWTSTGGPHSLRFGDNGHHLAHFGVPGIGIVMVIVIISLFVNTLLFVLLIVNDITSATVNKNHYYYYGYEYY